MADEDEESSHDEERKTSIPCLRDVNVADLIAVAKRKVAAESLAEIEKDFLAFREKYVVLPASLNSG